MKRYIKVGFVFHFPDSRCSSISSRVVVIVDWKLCIYKLLFLLFL